MEFVHISTTTAPVRTAAAKAVLWSLGLHLGGIAAALALEAWLFAWVTPAQFGGERVVIHVAPSAAVETPTVVELSTLEFDAPTEESEPTEVINVGAGNPALQTTPPATPRDVVQVERQTVAKAPVELLATTEPPRATKIVQLERPASTSSSANSREADPGAARPRAASRIARQSPAHRAVSSAVTAEPIPQSVGVDEIEPDLSGNRRPEYPMEAYLGGIEGRVVLRLHVAATGRVERVEVVQSSGHAILDRAAVEAVSTWRGRPAYRGDQPMATTQLLPVRFQLR